MKTAPSQLADGVWLVEIIIEVVASWPTATGPEGVFTKFP